MATATIFRATYGDASSRYFVEIGNQYYPMDRRVSTRINNHPLRPGQEDLLFGSGNWAVQKENTMQASLRLGYWLLSSN